MKNFLKLGAAMMAAVAAADFVEGTDWYKKGEAEAKAKDANLKGESWAGKAKRFVIGAGVGAGVAVGLGVAKAPKAAAA